MFPVFWTKNIEQKHLEKAQRYWCYILQVKILPKILIPHKTCVMSNPDPTTPKRLEANHHHPTQLLALHQVTLSQMCAHWQQMLYTNTIHYLCIPVILVKSWIRCLDQVELVCLYTVYIYIFIVRNTHTSYVYKKTIQNCISHMYLMYRNTCVCVAHPFRFLPFRCVP